MKRIVFAASLLGAIAAATAASAYEGEDEFGAPGYENAYPGYGNPYPAPDYGENPQDRYPAPYGRYGGRFGAPDDGYSSPRAARPPAPGFMPEASRPDTAGSIEAARRLYTVADTIALAGVLLCQSRLRAHTGMRAWSRDSMGPQTSGRQSRDGTVTVFTVALNGPAAKAGLRPGDTITAINGQSIPAMAGAMSIYAAKIDAALGRGGEVIVGYTRDGERHVARIEPAKACDYRIEYSNASMVNAATDGRSVTVMRGLINFLTRDEELALVVGHELSHNVLGHFERGRVLGHQTNPFSNGAQASLREFEREADYVGLYFVALAGYDLQTAIESSHKMAMQGPMGDRGSATHPSQAERYDLLQAALREIRAKQTKGEALKPDLRTVAARAPRERAYRDTGDYDSRLPIQ